jgi:hypothetical protein
MNQLCEPDSYNMLVVIYTNELKLHFKLDDANIEVNFIQTLDGLHSWQIHIDCTFINKSYMV